MPRKVAKQRKADAKAVSREVEKEAEGQDAPPTASTLATAPPPPPPTTTTTTTTSTEKASVATLLSRLRAGVFGPAEGAEGRSSQEQPTSSPGSSSSTEASEPSPYTGFHRLLYQCGAQSAWPALYQLLSSSSESESQRGAEWLSAAAFWALDDHPHPQEDDDRTAKAVRLTLLAAALTDLAASDNAEEEHAELMLLLLSMPGITNSAAAAAFSKGKAAPSSAPPSSSEMVRSTLNSLLWSHTEPLMRCASSKLPSSTRAYRQRTSRAAMLRLLEQHLKVVVRDEKEEHQRRMTEAEAIRQQREREEKEEDEDSYVDEDEGIMRKPQKPSRRGRRRKRQREEVEEVDGSQSQPPAVPSTTTATDAISRPQPTASLHMTEEEKLAHAICIFDKAAAAAAASRPPSDVGTGIGSFSPYLPSQDSADGVRGSVSPSRRSLNPSRKRFAFTQAEDDAIMAGVQEHPYVQGPSSFRLIYAKYANVWESGRTFVHLYDHWRSVLRPRTTSAL